MSVENFILKSWDEQQRVFSNNLAIIRSKPTKDAVHDLRVSVKKIRSYLRLQQKITGEEWKDSFQPIKLLFSTLGKFRDFEMSLSLLKKYRRREELFLPDFKEYLQVNRSLARQWAKTAAGNFNEGEFNTLIQLNKSLSPFTDEEIGNKIKQYTKEGLNNVIVLSSDFKKEAHEIRKLLKDLYYWLRVCPEKYVTGLINMKKLEQMLEQLGSWQDLFVFRKKLKQFRKEFLPVKSKQLEIVKSFEQKTMKEQDELLEKAKNSFTGISEN